MSCEHALGKSGLSCIQVKLIIFPAQNGLIRSDF
ncbi:Hypothetical protein BIBO2_1094 [Brucella sp. BO2]|nr:Hypothetical protein BIBO2_1094 [Brucella sp. BO2]